VHLIRAISTDDLAVRLPRRQRWLPALLLHHPTFSRGGQYRTTLHVAVLVAGEEKDVVHNLVVLVAVVTRQGTSVSM
jgi:hypothetical protein